MTPTTGVMLSGGLDSSSIALVAARGTADPLRTFSTVFNNSADERSYIDQALARGRFDPTFAIGDDAGPFDNFAGMLAEQGGLFQAPGLATTRGLYHLAAQAGVAALLDGHGGDETVSHGLGHLKHLALTGRWASLWRNACAEADIYGASRANVFLAYWTHFGPLRRQFGTAHAFANRTTIRMRKTLGRPDLPPTWRAFINPAFAQDTGLDAARRHLSNALGAYATETEQHVIALTSPVQPAALEVLDRAAAHAGIEARYPFWDRRLIDFCVALEPDHKIRDGWGRHILRRAMDGVLPQAIQQRRDKFDFTRALAASMIRHHRPLLDDILLGDAARIAPFVDLPALRRAYVRVAADPARASGADTHALWRTTALALWLQEASAVRQPAPASSLTAERAA
jgi:asparagine synthase (glutamine-hydrolysing)